LAQAHDGACLVDGLDDDAFYRGLAAKSADALVIVGESDAGCGLIALRRQGALRANDFGLLQSIGREATRVCRRLQLEESRRAAAIARETARRLAAEAKLASLRAQINPHFLFNTLDAVAALIDTDPRDAERLIEDLSDVLRRLVNDGRDVVALEDELALVDAYVKIEQARLGYPLLYETRLEPSTAGRWVPALSIQPLVENAVRHGAVPKQAPCSISVNAEMRDDRLCISVKDDGVGHAGAIDRRTGLRNVAERLTALYGPGYIVRFESRPGAGATASFSVPCAVQEPVS
jgi:two-component system sensor histidine kinase LytS